MLWLGVSLVFATLVVLFVTISDVVVERQQIFRSLRSVRSMELTPRELEKRPLAAPFTRRVVGPAIEQIGRTLGRLTPQGVTGRLRKEIEYAGHPPGYTAERVLAGKVLLAAGGLFMGITLARVGQFPPFRTGFIVFIFLYVGWYMPEWMVRSKSGKRQGSIRRALPDALDLLSITVEAGLGFDAALSRVAKQERGILGSEFHRVIQEMQLGKSRSESLRDLGDRNSVPELKSFVLAMIQADTFGISISRVLGVQAAEMRLKRRQRAEEQAQKVPVKIIFPLLTCIFPALFVIILGPAMIRIYEAFSAPK